MAYEAEPSQASRREVAVIGDYPMTLGFRLAGVKEHSVIGQGDQRRFDEELGRLMSKDSISVIIAAQGRLEKVSPSLSRRLAAGLIPIVVGIPDKNGRGEGGDTLRRMLKRSLGIEVKHNS
ncbi:MAG: V-type ATP synthase subunit F [Candidatus Altiarchaeota archaeon]